MLWSPSETVCWCTLKKKRCPALPRAVHTFMLCQLLSVSQCDQLVTEAHELKVLGGDGTGHCGRHGPHAAREPRQRRRRRRRRGATVPDRHGGGHGSVRRRERRAADHGGQGRRAAAAAAAAAAVAPRGACPCVQVCVPARRACCVERLSQDVRSHA